MAEEVEIPNWQKITAVFIVLFVVIAFVLPLLIWMSIGFWQLALG